MPDATPYVGRAMKRVEDPRLIRGAGTYTDDLRLPGLLHAAILRSPHAHAKITKIDTAAAKKIPGVIAVLTGADVNAACGLVPCAAAIPDLKAPMPIEPRAVGASYHAGEGNLTLWTSTQVPHLIRTLLPGMINIPENKLRVVAPEVGGGFGAKLNVYAEEALISHLAMRLGAPVK